MIQTILSSATYQANILAALQQTGIANTTAGGKARAFCDIVGDQLGILDANKANDLAQALLPYATGSNLDFLCQIYGVTRLPATDASSDASDNNFQFYVHSGTFGAINNGQPIVVPSGTLIYTSDPNGPVMATAGDATLNPGDSVQSVSVQSQSTGSAGNGAASVFNQGSFPTGKQIRLARLVAAAATSTGQHASGNKLFGDILEGLHEKTTSAARVWTTSPQAGPRAETFDAGGGPVSR